MSQWALLITLKLSRHLFRPFFSPFLYSVLILFYAAITFFFSPPNIFSNVLFLSFCRCCVLGTRSPHLLHLPFLLFIPLTTVLLRWSVTYHHLHIQSHCSVLKLHPFCSFFFSSFRLSLFCISTNEIVLGP